MNRLAVIGCGLLTGVGLDAPASCAAMRSGIDNFTETHFFDEAGEPIVASTVPLPGDHRGREKLVHLAAAAIRESLSGVGAAAERIPLLLCTADPGRPGRIEGLDDRLLADIQAELGLRFHARSAVIAGGRTGGVAAIAAAAKIVAAEALPGAVVAGVDSFVTHLTLSAYLTRGRLLTRRNSNGFIPGEAAGAIFLGPAAGAGTPRLEVAGIGFGRETATLDSEAPLRAEGLVAAIRAALAEARLEMSAIDYRIADLNGEQYGFREAALAMTRLVRAPKERFDLWHPADTIGETGAAVVPAIIAVAAAAGRKGYAPGPRALCHVGDDGGERAALALQFVG